jgi:hypothetical protein
LAPVNFLYISYSVIKLKNAAIQYTIGMDVVFMEKQSLLLILTTSSGILLPYCCVTTGSPIFATYQYWIFPLWIYMHDFGTWLDYGRFIPPFHSSFTPLLSLLGLIWCVTGICISVILYKYCTGKLSAHAILIPTLFAMLLQIVLTSVASDLIWGGWVELTLPLPFFFVFVLIQVVMQIRREKY